MLFKEFIQTTSTTLPKDVADNVIVLLKQKIKLTEVIDDAVINNLIISTELKNKLKSIIKKFNTEKNGDSLKSQLLKINGIGEAKAMELIQKNITTIKDLEKEEFFSLLSDEAKLFVKYKPITLIPRQIITIIENVLKTKLKHKFVIAGSYLRGATHSSDIDILTPDSFDNILEELKEFKKFVYSKGVDRMSLLFNISFMRNESDKLNINTRSYVKIDFFYFTKKDYVFQLNYLTGSKKFNILMRKQASKMGYLLNQKGLFKEGKEVPVKNEKELFSILEMKYLTPEQRNIL